MNEARFKEVTDQGYGAKISSVTYLLDDRIEIWHVSGLLVRWGERQVRRIKLSPEFFVNLGMFENVVDNRLLYDGGSIGTGQDLGSSLGRLLNVVIDIPSTYIEHEIAGDFNVTDQIGEFFLGSEEIVEEITVGLEIGTSGTFKYSLIAVHGCVLKGRELDRTPGVFPKKAI
jgi:hypothetical protein